MRLRQMARNDDVYKLFEGLTHRLDSEDWEVFALQSQYQALISGQNSGNLVTHSLLQPSIFEGFEEVIIAGACIEDTMLYRLWTGQGARLRPVGDDLRQTLRYDQHANGHLITIFYATEEEWSKTFRDKQVQVGQQSLTLLDRIVTCVGNVVCDDPFLWMANKDVPDSAFDHKPMAKRLPNSPHGLNEFQSFHNVVVLSALNPPPAHFRFMGDHGINGSELKTAHYRSAVYQAVMRSSIRNPNDQTPKRVIVMDRVTAEWLATLFPGAQVKPLDGMGVVPCKGKPGRPRLHESNAQKTSAHRKQQQQEWLVQLDLINNTSFVAGRYPDLAREVRSQMSEFAGACNENTLYRGDIVTPPLTSGTAFTSVTARTPLDYVDCTDDDSFISGLLDLHKRVLSAKEEAGAFSPATFDPDKAEGTCRGLDNITHVRGIWLDNDGGDLSHEEFARLFPFLRMAIWNTYSSTPEKPRWRVFIPTTCAMSLDVHRLVMDQIEKVLNKAGFWSKAQLEKNPRIKVRRDHGFDGSKFTASSLFYFPGQAKDPNHSFFIDHNGPERGPLDLHEWIKHCILDLRPDPEPMPVVINAKPQAVVTMASVSSKLHALSDALRAQRTESYAGRQQSMVEKAIDEWRTYGVQPGAGHAGFFKLAWALHRAGLDEYVINNTLYEEAGFANTPRERRGEIKGILRSLSRRGSLGRAA